MNHIQQASIILSERAAARERYRLDGTVEFEIGGESLELFVGVSAGLEPDEPRPCEKCYFKIVSILGPGNYSDTSDGCEVLQPKVSLTRSVISAYTGEPFITNQVFVDGDPIVIEAQEFDLTFYINYVNRFIESEPDMISYLKQFDSSLRQNKWYKRSEGGWLSRIINESRWNTVHLKARFGCLQHEDGLTFLEGEELKQYGYEPLLRAFKVKYANTSSSIVTDADVACKLEAWIPPTHFNEHVNQLFDQMIINFKTRKKTYFDDDLKEWRSYDGSLEAKKKIFLSQFSRYAEFKAKRRLIQKLIRTAENEVRVEKGFTVVGTLINESLLYAKLKEHFSRYTVMSQYRPRWLGRQSLDIYIEEIRVGIEYQGDQHNRPVEFFGGVEAFEKTKQRDQKKLIQCSRNGCRLVYVYPGYSFEDVLKQIDSVSC